MVYAWEASGDVVPGFPIIIPGRPIVGGSPTVTDLDGDGTAELGIMSDAGIFSRGQNALVHWFDLGVPYRPEGMEWPTWAHDMGRTGAYAPPVRRAEAEAKVVPRTLNASTPAPAVKVLLSLPDVAAGVPAELRLVKVDDRPVEAVVAAADRGGLRPLGRSRLVFRFDGEAVRSRLGGPGTHQLTFRTEVIGGLGGVQYEAVASMTVRGAPGEQLVPLGETAVRPWPGGRSQ